MSEISVYAFEDEDDEPETEWTTQSFQEAQEYARKNRTSIIERTYEYSDSALVEDYREGHALDGTKIEDPDGE